MVTLLCLQRYITPDGRQFEKGDLFRASEDEAQFLVVALGGEHFTVVPESLAPVVEVVNEDGSTFPLSDLAGDGRPQAIASTNDVTSAPAHMAVEHAHHRQSTDAGKKRNGRSK